MDFDDMPDSYFAFLSNQRKLAEPDKINGAMKDLARGSDGPQSKSKVKSRASQPNLAHQASKPSVPSLPSIQRTSTQPASSMQGSPSRPPSKPALGTKQPSSPQLAAAMSMRMQGGYAPLPGTDRSMTAPGRSNALVFTLVGILVAAIVVLAYLVLTK
jgi:hypothetical protein